MKGWIWKCVMLGSLMSSVVPATACLTISENNAARVNEEKTLIVWDEKTQTEHFIRKMRFDGATGAVGFLVPTPSVPELVPLDENAFAPALDAMARLRIERVKTIKISNRNPKWRHETVRDRVIGKIPFDDGRVRPRARSIERAKSLSVVKTQRVGPFEAATLAGDNAGEIVQWLGKNGFSFPASAESWLQSYATRGWKITAFKFAAHAQNPDIEPANTPLRVATIRLSFQTKTPFFPYREPKRGTAESFPIAPDAATMSEDEFLGSNREYSARAARFAPRALDVYFLSSSRVNAEVENGFPVWNATVRWAGPVARENAERLRWAKHLQLPLSALPATPYLTTFIDNTQNRPDGDLLFAPSKTQGDIVPPPLISERTETVFVP